MTIGTKQMRLPQVARNRLDIPEATWRQMLAEVGGVEPATELTQEGFDAMLRLLEHLGFRPAAPVRDFGERPGFATRKQIAFIRSLHPQPVAELHAVPPHQRPGARTLAREEVQGDVPALPDA